MAWSNLALELACEFAELGGGSVWERSTEREWVKYQRWRNYHAWVRATDPDAYRRMLANERMRWARIRAENAPEYQWELERRRIWYARLKNERPEAYLRRLERIRARYQRLKAEDSEGYALFLAKKRARRRVREARRAS